RIGRPRRPKVVKTFYLEIPFDVEVVDVQIVFVGARDAVEHAARREVRVNLHAVMSLRPAKAHLAAHDLLVLRQTGAIKRGTADGGGELRLMQLVVAAHQRDDGGLALD